MCPSSKFELFGFLDLYTIFMLVGVIACMVLLRVLADHRKMRAKWQNLVLFNALASVVLGYGSAVLFQAFYNFMDSGKFVLTNNTGATFYGGLIGGAVAFIVIYFVAGKFLFPDGYHKEHFADVVDLAAPCIAIAHGFGRLGCLMAGCCHGYTVETNAWYGIRMMDEFGRWSYRMPVQLFEALFLFLLTVFLVIMFWDKTKHIMASYMVFYGGWRIIAETMRDDYRGSTLVKFLTPSQLISVLLIIGGVVLFLYERRKAKLAAAATETASEATPETTTDENADVETASVDAE